MVKMAYHLHIVGFFSVKGSISLIVNDIFSVDVCRKNYRQRVVFRTSCNIPVSGRDGHRIVQLIRRVHTYISIVNSYANPMHMTLWCVW